MESGAVKRSSNDAAWLIHAIATHILGTSDTLKFAGRRASHRGFSRRHAAITCCSRAPMLMKTKKPLFDPAVAAWFDARFRPRPRRRRRPGLRSRLAAMC